MRDGRSGRLVLVSHCILNVNALEDGLAIYPGCEEDVIKILIEKGVGIIQIPCPEISIMSIDRLPMPKDAYENTKIRGRYRDLALKVFDYLRKFIDKGYELVAVIGAEGSPTCGISKVGKWKDPIRKGRFPDDVVFVEGMGIFMEELKKLLDSQGIKPLWIGIPGKSIRSIDSDAFKNTIDKLKRYL